MTSAILLMAAVAVARGSSFIFSKQLLQNMDPLNLLGVRSLLAFGVLMIFFGKRVAVAIREDRGNLTAGALLGSMYFLIMTLELNALRSAAAANASFIENSAVVLVPLAEAMLLKRLPHCVTVISSGLALAGIGCITAGGLQGGTWTAQLMLITAACLYTSAIIVTDRQAKKHDPFAVGILYVGFMGLFGMIGSFITEAPHLPQTGRDWIHMLLLALLCSAFGFAMQPVAQRTISSETAGLLTALNPLTTAVLGALILHEVFGAAGFIGAALIITGVMIHNYCGTDCN